MRYDDADLTFGGVTAQSGGPQLTEATLEEACEWIAWAKTGYGFAYRAWRLYSAVDSLFQSTFGWPHDEREAYLRGAFAKMQRPRMRKEFAPLYEGDKLIGQLMIERPFDAKDYLPFVERIHPDDEKAAAEFYHSLPGGLVQPRDLRVQRFNLHKGRYVLEGTET